jgi:hypothetical protein
MTHDRRLGYGRCRSRDESDGVGRTGSGRYLLQFRSDLTADL